MIIKIFEICSDYYNDFGRGGYYLIKFYDSYANHLLMELEENEHESNKVLEMVNCIADDLIFSDRALPSLVSTSIQIEAKSYIKAKKEFTTNEIKYMEKLIIIDGLKKQKY